VIFELNSYNRIYEKSPQVVFVGDSIIRRYAVEEYFPKKTVVNRGIFHDTSARLYERWNSTVSTLLPKLTVLMIGTNDIINNRDEFIVQNIGKLLDNAPPNSIIVSSIPPFGSVHCERNEKVLKINKDLKNLVESKKQFWIDAYFDLLDENGCLSKELSSDGIHLNGKGYSTKVSP
jgi:lysophospholipase L1-like esterase